MQTQYETIDNRDIVISRHDAFDLITRVRSGNYFQVEVSLSELLEAGEEVFEADLTWAEEGDKIVFRQAVSVAHTQRQGNLVELVLVFVEENFEHRKRRIETVIYLVNTQTEPFEWNI